MTEIERDSPSAESANNPVGHEEDSLLKLRRIVFWLAAIAFVIAPGYVLGVYFGFVEYRQISAQPVGALYRAAALRLTQIHMLKSVMLAFALFHLGRVLLRYGNALNAKSQTGLDAVALTARQLRCWQGLLWVTLLKAGWEVTASIVVSAAAG